MIGRDARAAGKSDIVTRKAVLMCSYAWQYNKTWCTDSMLSVSLQAGQHGPICPNE